MLYSVIFCPKMEPLDSVYWLLTRPILELEDGSEMVLKELEHDATGSLYGPNNTYREGDLYRGRTHVDYLLYMEVKLMNGRCVREVSCCSCWLC